MNLTVCVVLLVVLLVGTKGQFIEVPEGQKINDINLYDCYWQCDNDGDHWLDFMECAVDEVATGTCGVDNRAACDDNSHCNGAEGYSALRCCKVDVLVNAAE